MESWWSEYKSSEGGIRSTCKKVGRKINRLFISDLKLPTFESKPPENKIIFEITESGGIRNLFIAGSVIWKVSYLFGRGKENAIIHFLPHLFYSNFQQSSLRALAVTDSKSGKLNDLDRRLFFIFHRFSLFLWVYRRHWNRAKWSLALFPIPWEAGSTKTCKELLDLINCLMYAGEASLTSGTTKTPVTLLPYLCGIFYFN